MFDAGVYKEAIVAKTSSLMSTKQGFTLMLAGKKQADSKFMTTQRSDEPKVFKKLETAVGEAYEIGFTKVSIELKDWRYD